MPYIKYILKTTYRDTGVLLSIRRKLNFGQLAGQYTEILAPRYFRGQAKSTKSLEIQILTIQKHELVYNHLLTVTKATEMATIPKFKGQGPKNKNTILGTQPNFWELKSM
jgi:hypothetical protein